MKAKVKITKKGKVGSPYASAMSGRKSYERAVGSALVSPGVHPAYRGRYMTISNETLFANAMRDVSTLARLNSAYVQYESQVKRYERLLESAMNRNIARGMPQNEQIGRYYQVLRYARERMRGLRKEFKRRQKTRYECRLSEELYRSY